MTSPFYGSRRIAVALEQLGRKTGRKRVATLMEKMGLEAIYPKPRLSVPGPGAVGRYPYLLRGLEAGRPNHAWSADITCLPMSKGHMYLVAVMDWYSRYVLAWRLSNTLDAGFCVDACKAALRQASRPSTTPTKGASSPRGSSSRAWRARGRESAGTGAAGRWTTCSSSGCGGR